MGLFSCGYSSGQGSLEVAVQFPAWGLAPGQGVARRGARGWARARGPKDASVGAPLPSTGRRGRSYSAAACRLRARARAPHTEAVLGIPEVASVLPGAASQHLRPRLEAPLPYVRALPPTCFLSPPLGEAAMGTPREPPRPRPTSGASHAIDETDALGSLRPGGARVFSKSCGLSFPGPSFKTAPFHPNDQR